MSVNTQNPAQIRNIAIIAHVDHGKTTLVDGLLKQSQTFAEHEAEMDQELIMDSGDQEKERGITITAKVTAIKHDGYRINIVDTPGHADFSGEVERTLNMADGCLLVVDAQEGPMPQTKFVLSQALANNLQPIVVINKIDKPGSRIKEVENELADLFLELAQHEDQLQYAVYYAVGSTGKAWDTPPDNIEQPADLKPLLRTIIEDVPAPDVATDQPFQMLVTALAWDNYKGKYAIGRIRRGEVSTGDEVVLCEKDGGQVSAKIDHMFMSHGVAKSEIQHAIAGDIVQLTGVGAAKIGETIADSTEPEALPVLAVEAPTLKIYLGPNTSPFKGQEGEFTTSRQIGERLQKELETNVSLKVEDSSPGFLVSGRGELHLSVLIEEMRREGYEFEVGRPQVVTRDNNGKIEEPVEELTIEVPDEHMGVVQMELGQRRAKLQEQSADGRGGSKLVYEIPTRALLGLQNILATKTKGTVVMNSLMKGYIDQTPPLDQLRNGVIVAFETGTTTPHALEMAEGRGECFVGPAEKVYAGQIVGLNSRQEDIEMNVCKLKHLTNMRSNGSEGAVQLTPYTDLSLEQSLDFIENDELLEVTPVALRLRKRELDHGARKRAIKHQG